MEGASQKDPSQSPPPPDLGEAIYQSLLCTDKPNDNLLVLLSGAISLSDLLSHYLLNMKPRELLIFVGLKDFQILETNELARKKRQALLLQGQRPNKSQLQKISPLTKEKRREAYLQGGFFTLTPQILLLDLLSKSELPGQLITRLFLRDCDSTKTYKDQPCWLNHLVRVEGDAANHTNTFTQTIVVSQRVARMGVVAFENVYRFMGVRRVVLWPFGREEILERVRTSQHFEQLEHSLKMSENERKLHELLDSLLRYCSSRRKDDCETHYYELFTRELEEDLDYDYSDVLLLNMHQVRTLMFKLTNFAPVSCYGTLMRFLETEDQRALWTTTNKKAEGIIEEVEARMRREVFELRVGELQEVTLDFLEPQQTYKLSHSLRFLPSKPKKVHTLISTLTKLSESCRATSTQARVWLYASSQKLCQHLHYELHQWLSDTSLLRKHRELHNLLLLTRDRRLATIRHALCTKKPKSPHEKAETDYHVLVELLSRELELFFRYYCDFESHNLSNRDEEEGQGALRDNLAFLEKELLRLPPFRFLDVPELLKPLARHPALAFYSSTLDLTLNGNTELLLNSCQEPELVCQFLRLHRPTAVILYNPNIRLLRSLYLYGGGVAQVYGVNFPESLEQAVHVRALTQEDTNFWEIGKLRPTLPLYCDDFRARVAEIADFRIVGRSMLRHDPKNRADTFAMPTAPKNFIVIDKREYKSQLPCVLYFSGFVTVPVVLDTADYILAPEVAVEKKSVATKDIHESIRSGRLDDQLRRMAGRFAKPYLLIEFSKDIPFETHRLNVSFNHATRQSYRIGVRKALVGLLRKYPKVRLIWSHSCEQTAEIFLELKRNRVEPDITLYRKQDEEDLPELASQAERPLAAVNL